jgi:hypothetical protein
MTDEGLHADRLRLRGSELVTHFGSPAFFLVLGLAMGVLLVFGHARNPDAAIKFDYFMVGALIIGLFCGWIQLRALNFKTIETTSDANMNFARVLAEAKKSDWNIVSERPAERIIAMTHPEITWGGERVEVRFRGSTVLVNSICNPRARSSMDLFALNARNRGIVKRAVTQNEDR